MSQRPGSRAGMAPFGLAGALCLIAVIEAGIYGSGDRLMTPDQVITRLTTRNSETVAPGRDVLVFGDSLAKLSLAPRRIEAESGLSGFNLSISGSQAANSYFLFRRALDAGARPKIVLLDVFPPLQRLPIWHAVENDPFQLSASETLDLAWTARDATFLASMAARLALPSVRQREAIRTVAMARVRGTFERHWSRYSRVILRNITANDGAQIHAGPEPVAKDPARMHADYFPRWEISPIQQSYIDRFMDLARRRGIRVAWVLTPFRPELQELTERSGFDRRWTEYLEGRLERHPNLVILDGRRVAYPAEAFMDLNHLALAGASAFSRDVGRELAGIDREPEGPRWRILPRYRPETLAGVIEDLEESGAILRRMARKGRAGGGETRTR